MYRGSDSPLLLSLYIVPIILAAGFWGRLAGLLAGIASTAVVCVLVALVKPAVLPQVLLLCALFYVGIGGLVGRLFQLMKKVRSQNRELAQSMARTTESEERYRSLFERVPVGLYRTTPAGQIIDANRAMAGMLGFPDRQALLAVNAVDLYIDRAQREAFIGQAERSGAVQDMEARLRRHDAGEITVLISAHAVRDASGAVQYYEGSLKDITEIRKVEVQKQRTERLEAIGQLAAGIAHDFNNIIAGIRGFGEYVAKKQGEDPLVREAGERILSATERASRIVDGLLALLGTHLHDPRRVRVTDLVRAVCGNENLPGDGGIRIETELTPDSPWVAADPERIAVAIRELVDNAVRASDPGGRVTVRTGSGAADRTMFFAQQSDLGGTWAWISVEDRGSGMDEHTMERIFEPYFTTQRFGAGAGLGLARVYGIIRQHGGAIGIRSRPKEGTTVTLYLPIDKGATT